MKLLLSTALCTGLTLTAVSPVAAMEKTLSGLDVTVDLSAYEGNNVLKYWPTLEADLATAIASKVTLDDAADAPRIVVEINKVAIDGDTILPDTGEFNQLEGTVSTFEGLNDAVAVSADRLEDPDEQIGSYALQMTAVAGETPAPEGWVTITPSQDDFYAALVDAYATTVVERLDD
ncbi:MAG: hypothetical protein ACU0CB_15655 [Roseovarius sp.]|jgi:hypothetical protein|uniref:hypothetical protein n=1 Tax=Roseovarius sp. TaxID=1486281 RepID=UPI00261CC4FA|nr:hypothetical protein [Roseovarius sp.]